MIFFLSHFSSIAHLPPSLSSRFPLSLLPFSVSPPLSYSHGFPPPCASTLIPLTAEWALRALIDFTLSNARRFYASMGNPLAGKGLYDEADRVSTSVKQKWHKICTRRMQGFETYAQRYLCYACSSLGISPFYLAQWQPRLYLWSFVFVSRVQS